MDIKTEKEKLRKQIVDNGNEIMVVNTSTSQCWDKADTKVFALIVGKIQLYPTYLKNLGFDSHYKKSVAEKGLFYSSVLGMSRAFEIVYNLSSWLYQDIEKVGDAGYKIKQI